MRLTPVAIVFALAVLLSLPTFADAAYQYIQGGTGTTTAVSGQLIYSGAAAYQNVATTTASCAGSASCPSFTVIGSSPVTISASGSGGSPGGSSGQLQYNASGSFGAVSTSTLTAGTGLTGSFTYVGSGGSVALSTPVSIANGGTATSSAVTNGVYYFNGTNAEADNLLTFSGGALTAPNLTLSSLSGTQCLQEISGVVSGTGSGCASAVTNYWTSSGSNLYNNTGSNIGIDNSSPSYALDVAGFVNTDKYSGYKQNGTTILYASSTAQTLLVGTTNPNLYTTSGIGTDDTIAGYEAGFSETGTNNTAIGDGAMFVASSTSNKFNTYFGDVAGEYASTTNTSALGFDADAGTATCYSTGNNDMFIGYEAGEFGTTGNQNTAEGRSALQGTNPATSTLCPSYTQEVAIGYEALQSDISGSDNVAVGFAAGSIASSSFQRNVYIGANSGANASSTTNVSLNTFVGWDTGMGSATAYLTGKENTFLGGEQGFSMTTGSQNTLLGACDNGTCQGQVTTGSQNITLGYDDTVPSPSASGQLDIGNYLYGTGLTGITTTVSNGLIGIGTTTPSTNLSVQGNQYTSGTAFFGGAVTATSTLTVTGSISANGGATFGAALAMGANNITGVTSLQSNSTSGYKLISGTPSGTSPDIVPNRNDTTTGIGADASGNLSFIANANTQLEILNNGNVGIGTTSPANLNELAVQGGTGASTGAIVNSEYAPATSTSMTISMASSTQTLIQLGGSATTLTLAKYIAGQTERVVVCNPNGTAGALTWATSPANKLLWDNGTAPTQTTTAQACDVWSFIVTQATSTAAGAASLEVFGAQTPDF